MFSSAYDHRFTKRLARGLAALAFLIANTTPGLAQGVDGSALQRTAASYAGPAVMLGARIPFGGEATTRSQSIVGLRFGASWRASPGSAGPQGSSFVPTVEAGLSLSGDPVLRLSGFDVRLGQLRAQAEGAQGESFCGRNLSLCIIGGVALVGVAVLALGDWENCTPSDDYPPGQDPCKCYEADGCD